MEQLDVFFFCCVSSVLKHIRMVVSWWFAILAWCFGSVWLVYNPFGVSFEIFSGWLLLIGG